MERGDGTTERINYFTMQRTPKLVNVFNVRNVARTLNELLEEQLEAWSNFTERGSGWAVEGISAVHLRTLRHDPIRGGGGGFIHTSLQVYTE